MITLQMSVNRNIGIKEAGINTGGSGAQISYRLAKSFTLNSGFAVDIESLSFGAEFSNWRTQYLSLEGADNNKIQASVIWNF